MDDQHRRPLAEQPAAPGSVEAAAGAILRRVPQPLPLGEARLARIARRLDDAGARQPRWRPLTFALGAAFSAAAMALMVGWSHLGGPNQVWRVPEGSVAKLLRQGHVTYVLVGPASAKLAQDGWEGSLRLESGRVVARAAAAPLRIETPRGVVVVQQGATAEVALEKAEVVIAAFDSAVVLRPQRASVFGLKLPWPSSQAPLEVQPGQSLRVSESGVLRRAAAQPSTCAVDLAGQVPELACSPQVERPPRPVAAAEGAAGVADLSRTPGPPPAGDGGEAAPADAGQVTGAGPAEVAPAAPEGPADRTVARRRGRRSPARAATVAPEAAAVLAVDKTPEKTVEKATDRDGGAATPDAATASVGPLVAESRLLTQALQQLRQRRDGRKALALLDEYAERFPAGMLAKESKLARIDALLLLGRRREVLAAIETAPLGRWPRGRELLVLRAELRAEGSQCDAAVPDFTAALRGDAGTLEERALYGRAACRARRGDPLGAQSDFRDYLRRFPGGSYAAAVRRALGQP